MSNTEMEVMANSLTGGFLGLLLGGPQGALAGSSTAGISALIVSGQNPDSTDNSYVNALVGSAVNPSSTSSNVVAAVANSTIASNLPNGDATGQASAAAAIAGGVVNGPRGYAAGAIYPYMVEGIKKVLQASNSRNNCGCQ